jgi:receptor protein-tyrosine kinase
LPSPSFPTPSSPSAIGRHEYRTPLQRGLIIARRNWLVILICLIAVPVVAFAYSKSQTKEYTAATTVLFGEDAPQVEPGRAAATNLALATSEEVKVDTAEALGEGITPGEVGAMISAGPVGESDLIEISATDPNPDYAAHVANTYAREFIQFREDKSHPSEGKADTVRVAQPATAPSEPSSPKTTRNVALGIVLGIVLAIAFALLREQFDRRIKETEEIEEIFGLPVLATVPESRRIQGLGLGRDNGGEEAETFRMLRANLQYFNVERETKSILVTSPAPQDGKTTVSWNLAKAEAQAGRSVIFFEADLRRPSLSAQLNLRDDIGLSLVLANMIPPSQAIQTLDGVDVVAAGPVPPNPAELIDSESMRAALTWAMEYYDRVIIDTPPATVVADAVPLVNLVDGTLLVVRLGRTRRDTSEHLRTLLANAQEPILGVVVNGGPRRSGEGGYYSKGVASAGRFEKAGREAKAKVAGESRTARKRKSSGSGRRTA